METKNIYKSFNEVKTIEELQYNMLQYKTRLQSIEAEQEFYNLIIKTLVFKPHINLFERLEQFKKQINQTKKVAADLLQEMSSYTNIINNKIECNDLLCDDFFIKIHEELELKIYDFFAKTIDFKIQMFQYLQSVIKD